LKIIVGGPEANIKATHLLGNEHIDIAVFGEGEATFVEILNYFLGQSDDLKNIDGIGFRNANGIFITKPRNRITNLEIIPFPIS